MTTAPMTAEKVADMMRAGLPDAKIDVRSDDNTHFEAVVVSPDFEGLRSLQRHQKVYATLGRFMGHEIHALALKTYSTNEWQDLDSTGN